MFTMDSRVEVTPLGKYVSRLHCTERHLSDRPIPGLYSSNPDIDRTARQHVKDAGELLTAIRQQMARYGATPLGPMDPPAEGFDIDGYPIEYDGPGCEWTQEQMDALDAMICPTCADTGEVPSAAAGNMEFSQPCPECAL